MMNTLIFSKILQNCHHPVKQIEIRKKMLIED